MLAAEISSDYLSEQKWLKGSLATSTYFQSTADAPLSHHCVPIMAGYLQSGDPESLGAISTQGLVSIRRPHIPSPESSEPVEEQSWAMPVIRRCLELLALPADWDHHGAAPISPDALSPVLHFLRRVMRPQTSAPSLVPLSDGGIQIEWHQAGVDVEVPVRLTGVEPLYIYDLGLDREWEGPAEAGFAEHHLAERLTG
jgi:hypothetical protein